MSHSHLSPCESEENDNPESTYPQLDSWLPSVLRDPSVVVVVGRNERLRQCQPQRYQSWNLDDELNQWTNAMLVSTQLSRHWLEDRMSLLHVCNPLQRHVLHLPKSGIILQCCFDIGRYITLFHSMFFCVFFIGFETIVAVCSCPVRALYLW